MSLEDDYRDGPPPPSPALLPGDWVLLVAYLACTLGLTLVAFLLAHGSL